MISLVRWLIPNLITFGRILALPLFIAALFYAPAVWSAGLFLFLALTDALDGFLARRLNQISDAGKFWDPLADKILITSALICLIEVRNVPALPIILIVVRDLLISAVRFSAVQRGAVIAASPWGKVKTITQMIAVLMLILSWPYALPVLWLAVILTWVSGVDYFAGR